MGLFPGDGYRSATPSPSRTARRRGAGDVAGAAGPPGTPARMAARRVDPHARSCFSVWVGKGDETRAAVLDQAVEVARRVGLSGLTIGSLAEQTAMSKS